LGSLQVFRFYCALDTKYADLIEFFGTVTLSGLSLYQAYPILLQHDSRCFQTLTSKKSRWDCQAMSGGRDWHVFFQALETMEGQAGRWPGLMQAGALQLDNGWARANKHIRKYKKAYIAREV
jgi:hypothetical protein